MSRFRAVLLLLLPLLGSGCAVIPRLQEPAGDAQADAEHLRAQADAEHLRAQARVLRYSGRYAEALARLDGALALAPGDRSLQDEREQTRQSWRRYEQALADQLLVLDSRMGQERLPILESRVRADPEDAQRRTELDRLRQALQHYPQSLADCGRRQRERRPELARDCLRAALALRPDAEDKKLLATLAEKPKTPRKRPAVRAAKTAPRGAPPGMTDTSRLELGKAQEMMRTGNHFGAVRYLEKMTAKGEGSEESERLLARARAELKRSTEALLSAGDALYREGKVKAALALWQAALSMDPFNRKARSKSERALKVLANMQSLSEEGDISPPP
jgi:tetratricopeptide (TPR) repeat protein